MRSRDLYNKIPYYIRNKNKKNIKLNYTRYRKEIIFKPIVKKNTNGKYTLVWPGDNPNYLKYLSEIILIMLKIVWKSFENQENDSIL